MSGTPRLKLGVPVHEGLVTETQLPLTPAQRVHCFVPLGAKGWSPEAQVRLLSLCISHWFCHFLNSRQALASVSPTTEGLSPSLPYPALDLIISLSRDKRKKERVLLQPASEEKGSGWPRSGRDSNSGQRLPSVGRETMNSQACVLCPFFGRRGRAV